MQIKVGQIKNLSLPSRADRELTTSSPINLGFFFPESSIIAKVKYREPNARVASCKQRNAHVFKCERRIRGPKIIFVRKVRRQRPTM